MAEWNSSIATSEFSHAFEVVKSDDRFKDTDPLTVLVLEVQYLP